MSDEAKTQDALLSQATYHGNSPVAGFTLDQELSSGDWGVYVNDQTKRATIAFRGTDSNPKHSSFWKDMGANVAHVFGAEGVNSRYQRADAVTKKVIDKYGKGNVSVTGHSLGGTLATYVSEANGIDAQVYNPFITPNEVVATWTNKHQQENVHRHIIGGDIIPALGGMVRGGTTEINNQQVKTDAASVAKRVAVGAAEAATTAAVAVVAPEILGPLAAGLEGGALAVEGGGLLASAETAAAAETASAAEIGTAEELEPLLGRRPAPRPPIARAPVSTAGKAIQNAKTATKLYVASQLPKGVPEAVGTIKDSTLKYHSIKNFIPHQSSSTPKPIVHEGETTRIHPGTGDIMAINHVQHSITQPFATNTDYTYPSIISSSSSSMPSGGSSGYLGYVPGPGSKKHKKSHKKKKRHTQ